MLGYDSKSQRLPPIDCLPLVFSFTTQVTLFMFPSQSSHLSQFTEIPECRQSLDKMLEEAFLLSDELFDLQEVGLSPEPRTIF